MKSLASLVSFSLLLMLLMDSPALGTEEGEYPITEEGEYPIEGPPEEVEEQGKPASGRSGNSSSLRLDGSGRSVTVGRGTEQESSASGARAAAIPNCGNLLQSNQVYHLAKIQRNGGGVESGGQRYISYYLHFAVKAPYRGNVSVTKMHPYWTSHISGKKVGPLNRTKYSYYYHMTVRVKPGTRVGFDAHATFNPPVRYGSVTVHGTSQLALQCIAR